MKFKTEKYLWDFYGHEFKPGVPIDITEPTLIRKCKNNPLFKEVRKKRDSKRTVSSDTKKARGTGKR